MKKSLLLILSLFIFCSASYCQENNESSGADVEQKTKIINFFTNDVSHKATFEVQANNHNNLNTFTLGTSAKVEANMKELCVTTGFDLFYKTFSFTSDITYEPTLFNIWNIGARMINHYTWSYNTYFEYDFLVGLGTKIQPLPNLYFSAAVLYQQKNSHIKAIKDEVPKVVSNCPAFELLACYEPLDWMSFTLIFSSFTFTKYYLFFSPNTRIKAEFMVNPFLYIGISGEIQFVDFFTLSANFNRFSTVINITWRF